ncbi:MAG: alginate lyase family protein [Bacteroidota bacterium]
MANARLLLCILLSMSCISPLARPQEKDSSGPTIALQSNVYQVGNKWYCPLCRQEVVHGDRSGWDLRLGLSEWHDVLIDKTYFDKKIRYITDEELVNSLNIQEIEPALRKALDARDYDQISIILHDYFSAREDNNRLSSYDVQNKRHFITIGEFLQEVLPDTGRYQAIVRSARQAYTPETGFTLHGVNWGRRIDFNHHYPHISKWGVHYLSFINDQINHYLLTRDPGIARAFDDLFNQWYDQMDSVKQEVVIHHTSSYDFIWYELGLANRTQRLIDAQRVFVQHLSPETNKKLLKNILGSARWLDQCLEKTPFHPYNWQTHTALTLSYAALAFPEFRDSRTWLNRGRKTMILHLENDILDDGGYVERTPSYAEYMFSVFYRYMMMMQYFDNDSSLREKYLSRMEKYIEFFVLTNAPVGVNSPFNDAHRNKSLVRVFREMGEFFKRGDFIGAVRHEFPPEELASMPITAKEPGRTSIDFPNSQFVVMRDSWDPRSYFLILNYGEWQNHSHYDQLDFEIYANGIPIAVDAGIGKLGYLDSLHLAWYKHPASHNMITINQAVPEKRDMPGYDKVWSPQQHTEFFAATHDGYLRYQKARHRRHIVFAKRKYWLIIDEVNTAGNNQEMDFNFHTPCSMAAIEEGFVSSGENGFLIKQDRRDASNVSRIKSKGGADLGGLQNEPRHREIDWLVFRKALGADRRADRMATLIYPFSSAEVIVPADVWVERQDLRDEAAIGYRVKTKDREDHIILSDGTYRRFTDEIEGDFKYARISSTAGGVDYVGLTGVTKFMIDGVIHQSFTTRRDYEYRK